MVKNILNRFRKKGNGRNRLQQYGVYGIIGLDNNQVKYRRRWYKTAFRKIKQMKSRALFLRSLPKERRKSWKQLQRNLRKDNKIPITERLPSPPLKPL